MIFVFLYQTCFTQYDNLQVHPCCCKRHYFYDILLLQPELTNTLTHPEWDAGFLFLNIPSPSTSALRQSGLLCLWYRNTSTSSNKGDYIRVEETFKDQMLGSSSLRVPAPIPMATRGGDHIPALKRQGLSLNCCLLNPSNKAGWCCMFCHLGNSAGLLCTTPVRNGVLHLAGQ